MWWKHIFLIVLPFSALQCSAVSLFSIMITLTLKTEMWFNMIFTVVFMRNSSRGCNQNSVFKVLDWLSVYLNCWQYKCLFKRCIRSLFMLPLPRRQTQSPCNPAPPAGQTLGINHSVYITIFEEIVFDKKKKITAFHFHSLAEEWSHSVKCTPNMSELYHRVPRKPTD